MASSFSKHVTYMTIQLWTRWTWLSVRPGPLGSVGIFKCLIIRFVCFVSLFLIFRNTFRPWSTTNVWSLISCEWPLCEGLQGDTLLVLLSHHLIYIWYWHAAYWNILEYSPRALVCRFAKGFLPPFGLLRPCYHCQSRNSLHNLQQAWRLQPAKRICSKFRLQTFE